MTKLILLPGMDGTGELFAPLVCALDEQLEPVVIRYPVSEPLTYQQLLCRVRGVLPKDEPFFLLGESFSGPIAVSIAAERPEGLQGVILCASFLRNPMPQLRFFRRFIELFPVAAMPERLLALPLFGRFSTSRQRALLSKALSEVSPTVLQTRIREVMAVDVTTAVEKINVPMLYLQASEDLLVRASAATVLQNIKQGLRISQFKAPHMLLQVVPEKAAHIIEAFMAEVGSAE